MANIFIPSIVLIIIIYGLYKKINIYDEFLLGIKEGINTAIKIFPNIFAMLIGINILIESNIINDITNKINIFNYPKQLIPLAILRPISSSSSLIYLNNILKTYGADSIIGRVASVLQGSTDTTIYILGLYFSSIGIKKTKYALIVGLLADLMAVILSYIIINALFN